MTGNEWWVLGWGTVTVLAGIGCVLAAKPEDRADTALAFAGATVAIVSMSAAMWLFGWWPL